VTCIIWIISFLLYVVMDRSWINASRISDVYEKGVEEFLQFAKRNVAGVNNKYYCPCVNCLNGRRQDIELIWEHVLCDGFLKSYTIWTWHVEVLEQYSSVSATECQYSNLYSEYCMKGMIRDIGEDSFYQAYVYGSLKDDSETELYPDCSSFTYLLTILQLFNIKARNGWTDKSFTELLELFHQILP